MKRPLGQLAQLAPNAILRLPGTIVIQKHSQVMDIESLSIKVHSEAYRNLFVRNRVPLILHGVARGDGQMQDR